MLKIAHRGASGYAPENTIAAFKKAVRLKADMIELDVRVCKSGEPVIMHDADVDRTTNGTGKVKSFILNELQKLNAGNGEKIPSLKEVFDEIGNKAKLNINIKERKAVKATVSLITEYVKAKKLSYKNIVIASPNIFSLRTVKRINPSIKLSVIMRYFPQIHTRILYQLGPYSLQPHKRVMNKPFVSKAHRKGLKVFPWTLDEETDGGKQFIKKMKSLGVDGIISNYPDRI